MQSLQSAEPCSKATCARVTVSGEASHAGHTRLPTSTPASETVNPGPCTLYLEPYTPAAAYSLGFKV